MAQILIEYGSSVGGPLRRATDLVLADTASSLLALSTAGQERLVYTPSTEPLDLLWSRLETGALSSVQFRPDVPDAAWLLVYGPSFRDPRGAPWSAVAEWRRPQFQQLFHALTEVASLRYVVVSDEETLDLLPDQVSPPTFPWGDSRLIRAAVAKSKGEKAGFVVRDGPLGRAG